MLVSISLAATGCIAGDTGTLASHPDVASTSPLFGLNVPSNGDGSATADDLGASWVRVELVDYSTGTELSPDVAAQLSRTLDDYHGRNIHVLLLVDYASLGGNAGWGNGAPCGDWDGYRSAWLARIGSVASDFGHRIDAWEIWNEPDQPMLACGDAGYNPGMPAWAYGPLLRDADTAIRNAGADGDIVTGGLDSGQVSYIVDAASAAGGLYANGVSIHPYGVVPDDSWCPDPGEDLDCAWGTLGGKVDEYASATGVPVWITEVGIKTTDTAHQADYLAASYAAFASRGPNVAHAFWFCESDAMVEPYGLTFRDGTPKPDAYARYQMIANAGGGSGGGGDDGSGDDDGGSGGGSAGHTSMLHGTIAASGSGIEGLVVTAWGHDASDFHATTTDALGIYQFTDLAAGSLYNVVVNATFDNGGYDIIDGNHGYDVHDNVELVSGPDGWHGEDFTLSQ